MSEWISVDDRLPDDGVRVLISDGACMAVARLDAAYSTPSRPWWDDEGIYGADREWSFTPTHWAIAPDLPRRIPEGSPGIPERSPDEAS